MRFPERGASGAAAAAPPLRALVAACLCALSCASAVRGGPDRVAAREVEWQALSAALSDAPPAIGAVRVRLVFPARADLDLFVTDPTQETVYFANSPSRSGGWLDRDRRCPDPAPRVETVVFPNARPGRYRVGVDYPRPCGEPGSEVSFVVAVEGSGPAETRRGTIAPGVFLPVVVEVELARGGCAGSGPRERGVLCVDPPAKP